jgi:toxin ParE1/3/4
MASRCSPSSSMRSRSARGMARLVIAPEARKDLRAIRDYIATDNAQAARRVVTRLRDLARLLAGAPALGRRRPEVGRDLRSFVANPYVLFYRPLAGGSGIELARVLHGARDLDALFSADVE